MVTATTVRGAGLGAGFAGAGLGGLHRRARAGGGHVVGDAADLEPGLAGLQRLDHPRPQLAVQALEHRGAVDAVTENCDAAHGD